MVLRNYKIGQRIYSILFASLSVIFLLIILFLLFVRGMEASMLETVGKEMLAGQKLKIRTTIEAQAEAFGKILQNYPSDSARIALMRSALGDFRFEDDESGYIFVYEGTVNRVFPVKTENHDKDLGHVTDKNGVEVIVEGFKAAQRGGDYFEYIWPKPNEGEQPKVSYAKSIPGTKYWIGTGVYLDNIAKEQARVKQEIRSMANRLFMIIFAIIVVLMVLFIPIVLKIIQSITKPIKEIVSVVDTLSTGDTGVTLSITGKDEVSHMEESLENLIVSIKEKADIAEYIASNDLTKEIHLISDKDILGISLKRMQENLRELITLIQESSVRIDAGAENLSSLSTALSNSTTEQAASIEQISSSMNEVNNGITQASENSSEADEMAKKQNESAEKGIESMVELEQAIEEITESNTEISKIITVIEGIAFQTNLLALNAAVEAARAGQHGKGFAVVADEVRTLASRSSKAAHEVTELITNASTRVEKGVELSKVTSEKLTEIGEQSKDVAEMLEQIRSTSEGQALSIHEINQGITVIGDATQSNAASSEESAASAQELAHQALNLKAMTERFTI